MAIIGPSSICARKGLDRECPSSSSWAYFGFPPWTGRVPSTYSSPWSPAHPRIFSSCSGRGLGSFKVLIIVTTLPRHFYWDSDHLYLDWAAAIALDGAWLFGLLDWGCDWVGSVVLAAKDAAVALKRSPHGRSMIRTVTGRGCSFACKVVFAFCGDRTKNHRPLVDWEISKLAIWYLTFRSACLFTWGSLFSQNGFEIRWSLTFSLRATMSPHLSSIASLYAFDEPDCTLWSADTLRSWLAFQTTSELYWLASI